jgi:hypothetical protein
MREGSRILGALAALLIAGCTVDPVRDLERRAVGVRPRLLEACLPEPGEVEIAEDEVERLSYAWTLGERADVTDLGDEMLADRFDAGSTAGLTTRCEVILEVENGLVRKIELRREASDVDAACANRVRSCLPAQGS